MFIVTLTAIMIGAALVVFAPAFRKPLSVTQPDLYYSHVASQELTDNLNSRKTKHVKSGCEATVMIMRHCEKYFARTDSHGNDYCGYLGLERASYLATLFGDVKSGAARWPAPCKIFAKNPQRPNADHKNYKEADTVLRIADKVGVMVNVDYSDEARLAKAIFRDLRKGQLCGKLVLISWSHEIPTLAQKLGCGPYNGCPLEFTEFTYDTVYQIKFVYNAANVDAHNETDDNDDDDDANSDNDDDDINLPLLGGAKQFFRHQNTEVEAWEAHGSITQMRFDPLSFSAGAGDYPLGGKSAGGGWRTAGSL